MSRGPKPAKSKETKPPVARKSPKNDGARGRDLEKQLAESLEREKATGRALTESREQQTARFCALSRVRRRTSDPCSKRFSSVRPRSAVRSWDTSGSTRAESSFDSARVMGRDRTTCNGSSKGCIGLDSRSSERAAPGGLARFWTSGTPSLIAEGNPSGSGPPITKGCGRF